MNEGGDNSIDPIAKESVNPLQGNIEPEKGKLISVNHLQGKMEPEKDKLIEKHEGKNVEENTDAINISKGETKTIAATDNLNLIKTDPPLKGEQSTPMDMTIINTEENESQQSIVIQQVAGKSELSNEVANAEGLKRKAEDVDDNSSSSKLKKSSRKTASQSHLKIPIWYNSESVDALEVKNMPEFFSTETAYIQNTKEYLIMRNSIVGLYSKNPYVYLSATDCRKKITGDVCVVLKIHSFLDSFGVINFNVKAESRPTVAHPTLSKWYTDSGTTPSSSNSTATNILDYVNTVDWSEAMDRSLKDSIVANCGDWVVVSEEMHQEFAKLVTDVDIWKPTSEECLARFLSLALIPSSFVVDTSNQGTQHVITSIEADQKIRFLSSEIATRAAKALGCSTAQRIISDVLKSCKVIGIFFCSYFRQNISLLSMTMKSIIKEF